MHEVGALVDSALGLPSHPMDLDVHKADDSSDKKSVEGACNEDDKPALAFFFSASDEHGIDRAKNQLIDHIASVQVASEHVSHVDFLNDLSYSLSTRSQFSWRSSCTASSIADLVNSISNIQAVKCGSSANSLGFVFTGQGAQWLGMGLPLFQFAAYKDSLDAASHYFCDALGADWNAVGT